MHIGSFEGYAMFCRRSSSCFSFVRNWLCANIHEIYWSSTLGRSSKAYILCNILRSCFGQSNSHQTNPKNMKNLPSKFCKLYIFKKFQTLTTEQYLASNRDPRNHHARRMEIVIVGKSCPNNTARSAAA
jgi:hypothetical protein